MSYLTGNTGLAKKFGHRFGALLSAINKLSSSFDSNPSGVYTEESSSHSNIMGSTSDASSSTPTHSSGATGDQDTVMASLFDLLPPPWP